MKILRLSENKTINIGSVGSLDNENDALRLDMINDWLWNNDKEYVDGATWTNDHINLTDGRDFLKENKQYDLVVVQHVYNPDFPNDNRQGQFQVSDIHNADNWIRRLVSTNADYIFVFGDWSEVGGWMLGNLSGYRTIKDENGYQTVYRSERLPDIAIKDPDERKDLKNVDTEWIKDLKPDDIEIQV